MVVLNHLLLLIFLILSAESSTKKDKKFFGKDNFLWVFKTYYDDLVVNL